jgi:hypothetical protein
MNDQSKRPPLAHASGTPVTDNLNIQTAGPCGTGISGIAPNRTCCGHPKTDANVEWPGGLSPPGSPRTVREPLDSYGSRCSAVAMT